MALRHGRVCGIAALKAESIASHRHLSPWAAAGLVKPSERGRGIGAQLLAALERMKPIRAKAPARNLLIGK
ncbi:MAG: GNAT family N-acetyltransferase [Gammaproteobacteria bacterium]